MGVLMWCTMELCTAVLGKVVGMASEKPVRSSVLAVRISSTPLAGRSPCISIQQFLFVFC